MVTLDDKNFKNKNQKYVKKVYHPGNTDHSLIITLFSKRIFLSLAAFFTGIEKVCHNKT